MSEFTKLLKAGMRPMAVFMVLFIIGWLLTADMEVPKWLAVMTGSIISYLFGERKVNK